MARVFPATSARSPSGTRSNTVCGVSKPITSIYQTHWQDSTTPIEETMGTLLDLKREGKIRAIGVSNCTVDQVRQYRAVGPVDAAQEKFSLLHRDLEHEYLPYCVQNHMAVLAYSPLANGLLTGKVDPERIFPEDDLRRITRCLAASR